MFTIKIGLNNNVYKVNLLRILNSHFIFNECFNSQEAIRCCPEAEFENTKLEECYFNDDINVLYRISKWNLYLLQKVKITYYFVIKNVKKEMK